MRWVYYFKFKSDLAVKLQIVYLKITLNYRFFAAPFKPLKDIFLLIEVLSALQVCAGLRSHSVCLVQGRFHLMGHQSFHYRISPSDTSRISNLVVLSDLRSCRRSYLGYLRPLKNLLPSWVRRSLKISFPVEFEELIKNLLPSRLRWTLKTLLPSRVWGALKNLLLSRVRGARKNLSSI